jgi:Yip1 domain
MQAWLKVWRITFAPAAEWRRIADEDLSLSNIVGTFLLPTLLTIVLINVAVLALSWATSLSTANLSSWMWLMVRAIGSTLFYLLGIALLAFVVRRLAPRFDALPDSARACRAASYGVAPSMLATLLFSFTLIWPPFAIIAGLLALALGLWSIYVFHLGLGALMRPPSPRAVPYTASVLAIVFLIALLLSLLTHCAGSKYLTPISTLPALDSAGRAAMPLNTTAGKEKNRASETGAGGAGEGGAQVSGGVGEAIVLPPAAKGAAAGDPLNGVLHGGGDVPPRTILERYLPGDINGFNRKITDSYVLINRNADKAQNVLIDTAYVQAQYRATDGATRWRSMAIKDLTTAHGAPYADKLLGEIAQSGGESLREGGRMTRTVTENGKRYIVTEFNATRQTSLYEILIDKRYRVTAEAQGMRLDELRAWVESIDLAGLETRAKTGKPLE